MTSKTRRANLAYRAAYPDPLKLRAGDNVTVADKKTEWPGWLWCTAGSGKAGWILADYIERKGTTGTLIVDYDATELTVEAGEVLEVLREQSGWAWCRTRDGRLGWIPLEVLGS